MRSLTVAFSLFLMTIKRRLAYRGDLLVQSLDEVMRGFLSLALVLIAMSYTTEFAGWTKADLLFILGFSMVPIALFHTVAANSIGFQGIISLKAILTGCSYDRCQHFSRFAATASKLKIYQEQFSGRRYGRCSAPRRYVTDFITNDDWPPDVDDHFCNRNCSGDFSVFCCTLFLV